MHYSGGSERVHARRGRLGRKGWRWRNVHATSARDVPFVRHVDENRRRSGAAVWGEAADGGCIHCPTLPRTPRRMIPKRTYAARQTQRPLSARPRRHRRPTWAGGNGGGGGGRLAGVSAFRTKRAGTLAPRFMRDTSAWRSRRAARGRRASGRRLRR